MAPMSQAHPTELASKTTPKSWRIAATLLLAIGIFIVDMLVPVGTAVGVLYVAVLLLTLSLRNRRFTVGFAALTMLLAILEFFITGDGPGELQLDGLFNLLLSLFAIVTAMLLCRSWLSSESAMLNANQSLEERVRRRTTELESAVTNLKQENLERQRAQAEFEHEKLLLHGLMTAVPDDIFFKDTEGRYLRVNRAKAERSGLQRIEDAAGTTDADYFPPEHAQATARDEQRVISTGEPLVDHVENLVWPDGHISWASTTKVALRNPAGVVIGTVGISRDITEQHRIAEELQHERDRLRILIDNLPDIIFIKDSDYRLVTVNQGFLRQFDVESEEDVIGKTDFDLSPTELAREYREDDRRVIEDGIALYNREERAAQPDGELRWILTTKIPLRDPQGRAVGLVGICHDISQRKAAEVALKESESLYHTLADNLPISLIRKDLDGKITYVNKQVCELLEISPDDALGKTDYDLFPRELADKYREDDRRVAETGEIFADIEENRSEDRSFFFEVRKTPIRDRTGEIVGTQVIFWDVTARQQALKDLAEAKEAAEAANRAKSEFLANMSHEIRTPMNAVIGMTGLVLDSKLSPQQQDYLETVRDSAESLMAIINDLLDFSKIESGKVELEQQPFEIREWLGDAMKALGIRAYSKQVELAYQVDAHIPSFIVGDGLRLRQVIVNLVGNSIKFTEAGEVVLSVELLAERDDELDLKFSVRDTGIGISPEHREKIFSAFEQADMSTTRRFGGTGLGLAISSRLVSLMRGTLEVDSEPGVGSTFRFSATFGMPTGEEARVAPPDISRLIGLRVLIVDDNATNRRIVEEMCRNWQMQPVSVADAETALTIAKSAAEKNEPFQLVLTDGSMPDVDGFALSEQILGDPGLESTVVMMLSSLDRQGDTTRCEELGVSAYLLKPIKQSDLFDAIVLAVGAHPADAPEVTVTQASSVPQLPPLKLLLAEDSLANQKLAVGLLTKWGHEVTVANNGQEAVNATRTGSFDAVLMDVQMPEMDGLQATQEIRRSERSSDRRLPIIAMTAHAMKGDRERCLEAGMDGYVAKPIRPNILAAALSEFFPSESSDSGTHDSAPPATMPLETPGDTTIVDWNAALEAMQGDHDLLGEVVDACLQELPMLVSELQFALENGDASAIARYAHTIKGNLRTFSTNGMDEAQRLESAGMASDLNQAAELFQSLQVNLDRFVDELQKHRSRDRGNTA